MKPTEHPQRGQNWTLSSASGYGEDNRRARRQDRRHRGREATAELVDELNDANRCSPPDHVDPHRGCYLR